MTSKYSGNPFRFLPNLITLGNLFCGCLSISYAAQSFYWISVKWIIAGLILDFLDGFTARLLKTESPLGQELDSFSDLVSFGMAPSFLLFQILNHIPNFQNGFYSFVPFLSWSIVIFSSLRLARFNLGLQENREGFIGLPTPANALLICSYPIVKTFNPKLFSVWMEKPIGVVFLIILSSSLLILPIPLLSLKFKNIRWKGNQGRYLFLGSSLLVLLIASQFSLLFLIIPFILSLYLFYSFIQPLTKSDL